MMSIMRSTHTLTLSFVILSLLCFSHLATAAEEEHKYGTAHKSVVHLTTSNFQTMLEDPANGLFLLKFYAPWVSRV